MPPPLRRGPALVRQRLAGLLFLVVLTALVALSVGLYTKAFTPVVTVTLQADRAGNQLTPGADVKARGVIVGEVRDVTGDGSGARVQLALDRRTAGRIPSDTRAQLLPKTLFGEKFVALVFDDRSPAPALADGDVIGQDRSHTARELATALDNLLPLLQTLQPEQVSTTLHALSTTLRGRGDRLGGSLVLARDHLRGLNPELAVLAEDFRGVADLADTLTAGADDLVQVLDDLSAIDRSLVDSEDPLETFLRSTSGFARTAEGFVSDNEQRFVALAAESVPNLQLLGRYSPTFPCMLGGLAGINDEGERVFGGDQPGLHITLEYTDDMEGYRPGQEPVYGDDAGPTCFGLDGEPIRPFPAYRNPDDGYRDGEELDPRTGRPPGERGRPLPTSRVSWDREAVGAAVAPALGLTPAEVPDVALLLFGPVGRGT